jgi:putative transposase
MESRRYPTDSVRQRMAALHQPASAQSHRKRTSQASRLTGYPRRRLLLRSLKSGCPWRLLPRDFPPWKTVYGWFRKWRIDGTWERLNTELRQRLRGGWHLGRDPTPPSAGIVDSHSARTTGVGGTERDFDPAKRRRWKAESAICWWTPRDWCSRRGSTAPTRCPTKTASGCSLLDPARDRAPWAPFSAVGRCSGYQGRGRRWAEEALGLSVEVVVRKPTKLVPEKVAKAWAQSSGPRRVRRLSGRGSCHLGACGSWVVGGLWSENLRVDLCHNRRMAKDYERLLRHRRGFRLRGDDAAHGERVGPSVRVSRQSF